MSTIYQSSIKVNGSSFSQAYRAGTVNLVLTFQWAYITQEIYDDLSEAMAMRRSAVPLIDTSTGEIVRDYDYITYWSTVPTTTEDILLWLSTDPLIPFFPSSISEMGKVYAIQNEYTFANELIELFDHYEEQLYWQVVATKDDEQITLALRPGGSTAFEDGTVITFLSDREYVWLEDLAYVTLQVEVPE